MKTPVLIIDDSLTVRMDLGEIFEAASFATTLCASLAEAREALEAQAFALVVLDVLLPDGDGLELLREIKSTSASTPVILLSSEAEVAARVRGLRTGADEYVGKPYDRSYLMSRARSLVRRATPRGPDSQRLVLLIDDSRTFREALRDALSAAGYAVALANSGETGLVAAADLRPDAIIVDGQMDGIDGATVVRRIRADAALRRTPCILLTASDEDPIAKELDALDAGADFYVRKEMDPSVVLARLGAILRVSSGVTPAEGTASLHTPKKILVVDDSLTYLEEVAGQLRQEGYAVVLAHSGEEAIELLAAEAVDAILLDMVMDGLSGKDACRIIKNTAAWRDIPLIIHSAREERVAMIEGINAGADDYVTKAADIEVLRARLRAQLRRRQFEDENRGIREQLLEKEMEAAETRAARELAESRAQLLAELQQTNAALLRANHEVELQNRHIEAANRLKSEFLANMSHELRTPLNAIIGFSELLHDGQVSPTTPRHHEYLGHILTSAHHLLQLINDVLDLAKVEAGKMHFEPRAIDPSKLVREVLTVLQGGAADKRIRIESSLDPTLTVVELDPARLKQVLYNYVSNAIKFTPEGGRVTVRTRQDGEAWFLLEVEDTGIGIASEDLGRLFVEFQQLDAGPDKRYVGTGLGLAFSKRIVEAQGGEVAVRSTIGQGSTFSARLPRRAHPAPEAD